MPLPCPEHPDQRRQFPDGPQDKIGSCGAEGLFHPSAGHLLLRQRQCLERLPAHRQLRAPLHNSDRPDPGVDPFPDICDGVADLDRVLDGGDPERPQIIGKGTAFAVPPSGLIQKSGA